MDIEFRRHFSYGQSGRKEVEGLCDQLKGLYQPWLQVNAEFTKHLWFISLASFYQSVALSSILKHIIITLYAHYFIQFEWCKSRH